MSAEDRPVTLAEATQLAEAFQAASAKAMGALLTVSHQAAAASLIQALLVRELDRAGLIDRVSVRAEAMARAEPLGPGVVAVIEGVFGGRPPPPPKIPPGIPFTVIRGGRADEG